MVSEMTVFLSLYKIIHNIKVDLRIDCVCTTHACTVCIRCTVHLGVELKISVTHINLGFLPKMLSFAVTNYRTINRFTTSTCTLA